MIIKGFEITRAQSHATHLQRTDQNEHVLVQEIRGFVSDNLHGAFKEAQAIARGTKCKKFLFSCAFSPPESASLSDAQFMGAIDKTEDALGLGGQPRAIVFHEKDGRRHAHCVWSRIDAQTMKARQLSHYKLKLGDVSRALHQELGIDMPRGFKNREERDKRNFSQTEWQMAKRVGEDPRWLKEAVQSCWAKSDNRKSFEAALESKSLLLAKGDVRGFVVVDLNGVAQPVSRLIGGKTKDVKAKLGVEPPQLSVADAQKVIAQRATVAVRALVEASREKFKEREAALKLRRAEMTERHRAERSNLTDTQKQAWIDGTRERQSRLPRGVRGLWSWITGNSAIVKARNEQEANAQAERAERERFEVAERQRAERRELQRQIEELRKSQAEQLLGLRSDLGRYFKLARSADEARSAERGQGRERARGRHLEP
jgi:hypothetical protein